jgi:predicted amidohydrolase
MPATDPLHLDILTWDVTPGHSTARDCVLAVIDLVSASWDSGADLVLLPEFTWMMLEPLLPCSDAPLHAVARHLWDCELPFLRQALARPGKAAVLGTCPFLDPDSRRLFNRAPILRGSDLLHQDKLHLTPWETAFSPGTEINLFTFKNFTIAVIICLDIEVPELSARLRGRGIDLILCPSATETELGTERVDRCASARAVELGCHVAVSHLLGRSPSDLIDANVGRVALYHPSQVPFSKAPRCEEGPIHTAGIHRLQTVIEPGPLRRMRARKAETNPALLHVGNTTQCLPVTLS